MHHDDNISHGFSYESLGENDDSTKDAIIPQVKTTTFRFFPFFTDFLTFLGDFAPERLDSRGLQTLWE